MEIPFTPIAAAVVSTVALLGFVWAARRPRTARYLGPAADWWETLRRVVLPRLHTYAERYGHFAAMVVNERAYVGRIDQPPERVEDLLWEHGFRRMPLASFKTLSDGTGEIGSWAFRESLTASEQLHVMLFPTREGTAVYAHMEANALSPFTALDHYRGVGYNPEKGRERVKEILPEVFGD